MASGTQKRLGSIGPEGIGAVITGQHGSGELVFQAAFTIVPTFSRIFSRSWQSWTQSSSPPETCSTVRVK